MENTQKNFRISKKLLDDFQKICTDKGMDDSEILRFLILQYVEQNKENPNK